MEEIHMSKSTRMRTLFNKTNRVYFNGTNSHYFMHPLGVYCVYIDDIDESYKFDRNCRIIFGFKSHFCHSLQIQKTKSVFFDKFGFDSLSD